MVKNFLLVIFLFPLSLVAQDLTKFVNPFVGTGGHGHTFPGATAPFGFCQLSPDTRIDGSWDGCGGYHYSDSVIYGFSHTHLSGTGVSDYGDILLMPVNKEMALDNYQYKSNFSHENESATAGYYQVFLDEPKVNVELTTSRRCGFHKYTFPENAEQYVVLDLAHRDEVLDSKMEQVDEHTIRGYRFSKAWATNQKIFYEIKFEHEIETILYEQSKNGSQTAGVDFSQSQRALIKLKTTSISSSGAENRTVLVKVGISGVDEKGAHNNLENEITHWDFAKTKKWVQDEWNNELGKIIVSDKEKELTPEWETAAEAGASNKKVIFYTALYHSMIAPNIYNDVDNRYRGRDDKIHSTEGKFDYYTVFSLWDTYRALHPLLTIIDKKRTNDFINTFIKQYEQGGRLPVWELSSNETNCMIGYHAVSVIWDAYNKGIRDYDAEKAFEAMKSIATENTPALESYMKYGYVRAEDDHESVSKTLEYAYDDWCIAQMAKALGKESDYKTFEKRSHNWINVYDPTTGFMRARKNSTLMEPFSPYLVDNNYTEANAWQYSFYVPHEVNDLIEVMGGADSFEKKLDALFTASTETMGREQSDITGLIGQYAHGNEPSHHIAYLYYYINERAKGDEIVTKIMQDFYLNSPDGLIGNEDCGQMSAWYVLNASRLYSFCPGMDDYVHPKPIFDSVLISNQVMTKSMYELITFGYGSNYKIVPTGSYGVDSLAFFDKLHPTRLGWRFKSEQLPFDVLHPTGYKDLNNPFILSSKRMFSDSIIINFLGTDISLPPSADSDITKLKKIFDIPPMVEDSILFSINNGRTWESTKSSIVFKDDVKLLFRSFSTNHLHKPILKRYSPIQTATFTKLPDDKEVFLKSKYSQTYHAGGPMGLVDGINGTTNWRAGEWQGYQGQDFEAVVKYTGDKKIIKLSANFLADQRAWIFYPTEVSFYESADSINWNLIETISFDNKQGRNEEVTTFTVKTTKRINASTNKQFIKIHATNYGALPAWHPGAGNPAYIFIDEIEIN